MSSIIWIRYNISSPPIYILKNIDNNVLKEQARKNVIKAQQYSKSVLDERRSSFLNEFKNDI